MTDIQSQQLALSQSFSARVAQDMVSILAIDFRNLKNEELSSFHPTTAPVGEDELADRFQSSEAKREEIGLEPIPEREFYDQVTASQSAQLFEQYLNAAGLETELTDDYIASSVAVQAPHRDDRAAFIFTEVAKGRTINTPEALADVISDPTLSEQIYVGDETAHIIEPTPKTVADHDTLVNEKLQEVLQYLRQYLR